MNGNWNSWGAIPGNTPRDYIAMWRHVVSIFREEGATNVRWVWSPNVYGVGGVEPFQAYYPGDGWVDYVSLDGYNWGDLKESGWRSFAEVFESSYRAMTALTGKPLMISETATPEAGGDKAAWIREIITVLPARMPRVRALIWFDRVKETDWRIDSSPASDLAFRELAAAPRFGGTGGRTAVGAGAHHDVGNAPSTRSVAPQRFHGGHLLHLRWPPGSRASGSRLAVEALEPRDDRGGGEALGPLAAARAHPAAQLGVGEQRAHRAGERGDVAARDEEPVVAVGDHLAVPAWLGADDRPPTAHRLVDDVAQRLRQDRGKDSEERPVPGGHHGRVRDARRAR